MAIECLVIVVFSFVNFIIYLFVYENIEKEQKYGRF